MSKFLGDPTEIRIGERVYPRAELEAAIREEAAIVKLQNDLLEGYERYCEDRRLTSLQRYQIDAAMRMPVHPRNIEQQELSEVTTRFCMGLDPETGRTLESMANEPKTSVKPPRRNILRRSR